MGGKSVPHRLPLSSLQVLDHTVERILPPVRNETARGKFAKSVDRDEVEGT